MVRGGLSEVCYCWLHISLLEHGSCARSTSLVSSLSTPTDAPTAVIHTFRSSDNLALKSEETYRNAEEEAIPATPLLRPLTSLNWPYVPDESAFPDPLKRDDPKPLQLRQYEAMGAISSALAYGFYLTRSATSPRVREVLAAHPQLKDILWNIESLRGVAREEALQRGLGVSLDNHAGRQPHFPRHGDGVAFVEGQDRDALRQLAEAVEAAVRGDDQTLGLDWGD
jgi:hypothetical protein